MALTRILAVLVAICIAAPVVAQPPPHAKAHGWRKKNDPNYIGYTGKKWEKDYGVIDGHCDATAVGTVVGGVVGGAVGSRTTDKELRPVAILVGAVIGAAIGAKIGRQIDQADRACMGHALELAGENRTVAWKNNATGVAYQLTPTRNIADRKNPCREFKTTMTLGERKDSVDGVACRRGAGDWVFKSD
jgi:surface antigen